MNRQSTGGSEDSETILYDIVMMEHYIFVKTHRMYNTVSPEIKYEQQLILYQYWLISFTICTKLMQNVNYKETVCERGYVGISVLSTLQ